jgi:uracil-DNA glycosylase
MPHSCATYRWRRRSGDGYSLFLHYWYGNFREKIHGEIVPMRRTTQEPPGFPDTIPSPPGLEQLHEVMVRCTRCDLALSRTQVVPGAGNGDADILIVGEAPGVSEDRDGVPFVGASGRLLDEMLALAGIPREQVFIANVVRCRPPGNRSPRVGEIRACAGWLAEQIRLIQPRLVVVLGRFALQHFLPSGKITQLQGTLQTIDYEGRRLGLFPVLHPAAVLRSPDRRPDYEAHFRQLGEVWRSARPG